MLDHFMKTFKITMQLFNFKSWMVCCVALAAVVECCSFDRHPDRRICLPCPPFWVPFQASCYRIFGTKLDWAAAEASCNKHFNAFQEGHLVSIRNEAENQFLTQLWDSSTGGMTATSDYTFWIGLTDACKEGEWKWTDNNKSPTYTNWYPKQPDNFKGDEDCAHQWKRDPNRGTWNDYKCTGELYYVCELPQNREYRGLRGS